MDIDYFPYLCGMTFQDLKLPKQFLQAIEEAGYTVPTPIQERAIPAAMGGQHLIGIAQTGTGKTAAYLLPLLNQVKFAQGTAPRGLVLVPTKELAVQVGEHIAQLSKYTDLRCAVLYGGVGKTAQTKMLVNGVDVVVTTPRRLMELYEDGSMIVKQIKFLVLDEADRMLDMGFLPQLNLLLDILPMRKQVMLFSATFPEKVEKLCENFLELPMKIEIAPQATTAETIEQVQYQVPNLQTKLNLLEFLLSDSETFSRVIVFTKTKENANAIHERAQKVTKGNARVLHSNKDQNARINAFNDFKDGKVRVLVATDVAARGIDVTLVTHVINFDVPILHDDYVHRVGRTGRALNDGIAMTFVNMVEEYHMEMIEKKIRKKIPVIPIPDRVSVPPTPFEENQLMLMEIDARKQKADPTYRGAFHEKTNPKAIKYQSKERRRINLRTATEAAPRTRATKTSKHHRNKPK